MGVRVAVIGATGYSGVELLRILSQHPEVQLTYLTSESSVGKAIHDIYPHLSGIVELVLQPVDPDAIAAAADLAFVALPAGLSTAIVPNLLSRGLRVIDLGGDFRLPGDAYRTWYGKEPAPADVQRDAVYGLPEVWRESIQRTGWVTNPGCFATTAELGLLPALVNEWVEADSIIIDAKSGVSGAGRGVKLDALYAEVNESFKAYRVGKHQHTPEIEQCLSMATGNRVTVSFTTHLLPMTRGILATSYAKLRPSAQGLTTEDAVDAYRKHYAQHPFVRVRNAGVMPATKDVTGSNYCDIGLHVDARTGQLIIVSVLDNLMKGAAGQAVQNMNLMSGFEETCGLRIPPLYP